MKTPKLIRMVEEMGKRIKVLEVKIAGDKWLAKGGSPWALIPTGYFNMDAIDRDTTGKKNA